MVSPHDDYADDDHNDNDYEVTMTMMVMMLVLYCICPDDNGAWVFLYLS